MTNKRDAFTYGGEAYKSARRIARNTWRWSWEGGYAVRLHRTDVVSVEGERVTLDSGGWRTPTTKDRINMGLRGYRLTQERGEWFVTDGQERVPFYDGMVLPDAFKRPNTGAVARDRDMRARIEKMVKLLDKGIPAPGAGDCWGCSMRAADGTRPMGGSCVKDHIRDGYLHGSLVARAIEASGRNPAYAGIIGRAAIKRALRTFLRREAGI